MARAAIAAPPFPLLRRRLRCSLGVAVFAAATIGLPWQRLACTGLLAPTSVLASASALGVPPVTLLLASCGDDDMAAISLAGEPSCAASPAALAADLDLWQRQFPQASVGSSRREACRGYRSMGFRHVRKRLIKLWEERRLLIGCYSALSWLRSGQVPGPDGPPKAENVMRDLNYVSERPAGDATDAELREWVSAEYGRSRTRHLAAAASASAADSAVDVGVAATNASCSAAITQLKAFFEWFREHYPYYRGACDTCGKDGRMLGLERPDQVLGDAGATVAEVFVCSACGNRTTLFPRHHRHALPVLQAHRGRCGEYSWVALRLLESLGLHARYVDNHAGHVWVEVCVSGRWVHVDPCEAAVDQPFLYADSWGRTPNHVLAYAAGRTAEGIAAPATVEDVTERYRPSSAGAPSEATRRAVGEAVQGARAQLAAAGAAAQGG